MTPEFVFLDANNMLAGTERFLEVAVVGIDRPGPESE
jgi:FKBP-type peptidyl-prolyl cis-trans isomerase 2